MYVRQYLLPVTAVYICFILLTSLCLQVLTSSKYSFDHRVPCWTTALPTPGVFNVDMPEILDSRYNAELTSIRPCERKPSLSCEMYKNVRYNAIIVRKVTL